MPFVVYFLPVPVCIYLIVFNAEVSVEKTEVVQKRKKLVLTGMLSKLVKLRNYSGVQSRRGTPKAIPYYFQNECTLKILCCDFFYLNCFLPYSVGYNTD